MIIKKPSRLKKVIKNYPIAVANSKAGNLMADGKYQAVVQNLPKSQIIRTDRVFK